MSEKKSWAVVCMANGPHNPPYRTGSYATAENAQKVADDLNSRIGQRGYCPEHHSVEERK